MADSRALRYKQKERLDQARRKAREMQVKKAEDLILRIDGDRIVPEIESLVKSANDHEAAVTCHARLLDLTRKIDWVEDVLSWPEQVNEANQALDYYRRFMMDDYFRASSTERREFLRLEREIRAILDGEREDSGDKLRDLLAALTDLGSAVLVRSPDWWVARFKYLEKHVAEMSDRRQGEAYLDQGRRAQARNDFEALQAAVRQLDGLMPHGPRGGGKSGPIIVER